jgi:putative endonuclease
MPTMARRAEPLKAPKAMPRPERVEAFRRGLSAESRAALLPVAKAYRILARRWETPFGEIDIVARRRGVLVFVEVKARASTDDAVEAVIERTKHRIVSAAGCGLLAIPDRPTAKSVSTSSSLRRVNCRTTSSMPSMQEAEWSRRAISTTKSLARARCIVNREFELCSKGPLAR